MFDQLFTRQAAVVRYQSLPFAAERQLYLKHLVEEGRSRKTVRNIAQLLVIVVRHLRLNQPEITLAEINAAAVEWAGTAHRSRGCLRVGERQFVYHATGLLRPLGRLRESRPEAAYAARLGAFLDFQRHERCLSPSTDAINRLPDTSLLHKHHGPLYARDSTRQPHLCEKLQR